MKVAVIAKGEQIELQALALHHPHVWNVTNANLREIGLARDRAQRREFRAVEPHPIVVALMLVHESLKHFGSVIHPVLSFLAKGLEPLLVSFCHCMC